LEAILGGALSRAIVLLATLKAMALGWTNISNIYFVKMTSDENESSKHNNSPGEISLSNKIKQRSTEIDKEFPEVKTIKLSIDIYHQARPWV
jgi:hypothetical protein